MPTNPTPAAMRAAEAVRDVLADMQEAGDDPFEGHEHIARIIDEAIGLRDLIEGRTDAE